MSSSDTSGAVAERLLKLAIAFALLIILLGPILAISLHFAGPRLTDFVSRNILHALYKSGDNNGITSGPQFYALEGLEEKLTGLSAFRGEAKGAAKTLQILLVRFDRPVQAESKAGALTPLTLDLDGAKETATVLIIDRPLLIAFDGKPPVRRAILGVEGVAPFDLKGAPQGVLSGFRIAAFGASRVARPDQFVDRSDAHIFCSAIKNWRSFYGLPQGAVRIAVASNPSSVTVDDARVSHDGDAQAGEPVLGMFCKSY